VVTLETLEPPSLPAGYDNPTRAAVEAAAHLVAYRDGLFAHLMWLAEATSSLSAPGATEVFARLLAGLGNHEAMRRAAQIVTLAEPCWGQFRTRGAERIADVEIVRMVCLDTATAVRDALHRDSCVCGVAR
jgi:hypothetical protein